MIRTTLVLALMATGALAESHDPRPELVIAMPVIQRTHEALGDANFVSRVSMSLFDRLVNRDWLNGPNGNDGTEIVPGIFTEWEQVDDLTWEFKIRDDVVFHNGRPMTIDDVAFTISAERIWGPEPLRPHPLGSSLAAVDIVDDSTLRVTTKFPDPVLLQRFAYVLGNVVPADEYREAGAAGFAAAPIGTGPYKWNEYRTDDMLELVAHDEYWGETPPFSKITFRAVPETSARIAGLITGEYDVITSIPPDQAELIDREGDYETRATEIENYHGVLFVTGCGANGTGCDTPAPTDNPLVRRAMIHAVDRANIADRLWNGLATVPAGPTWPLFGDYHDPSREPLNYDPDLAKALLQEAGYDGEEIRVLVTQGYYVNGDRAMQVALQQWRDIGLNVDLRFVENWSQQQPYGEVQDALIVSANVHIPDPVTLFWNYGNPSSWAVRSGLVDLGDDFLKAGETLERTLDPEVRKAAFNDLLDIYDEVGAKVMFYRTIEIYGVRKDLEWTPYSAYWMDFRDHNAALHIADD
ncbi:MAG: ABC transporter substrate-binding protein [Pseudomonadota bacterium]